MWQITTTTGSIILGMLLLCFNDSMNVNGLSTTRTQQQNQQHNQWTSMKTMDFLSSSSRGRNRQLQEVEIVTTTSEFPVLISEIPMEERVTTVYNSSEIPADTLADVVIYGCTPAGLFTALRLLDPSLTQDTIREDVATEGTNLTVVIMEPSNRCGGRLLTAQYSDEFLAELGDLGYFSSGKSYADVVMEYFNLETKSVDVETNAENMLYLRGRHARASSTASGIEEIYRNMNFVERGQSASDLLMYAVNMLLPGAFDLNETEWNVVFDEASMGPSEEFPQGTNAYRLSKMGFWNALSQVLSHDACDLVTTYYQDMLMIKSNMNALEAIVSVVQTMSLSPNLKTPVLGMESIVWELYARVLELGGFITLDAIMTDLIPTGTIDPLTNSSSYDVTFELTASGDVVELTDVSSIIMGATPDTVSTGTTTAADASSSAAYRLVSLQSDFFLLEDNTTNTTDMIDLNVTLSNGTISTTTSDRLLYPEPVLTVQNTILGKARMPIHYARIYMCYEAPWWNSIKIQNGRSVTDLPMNSVVYFSDDACLTVCANGPSSMYWKQLANAGGNMFMPSTMKEELMVDFTVWETRWDDLADTTPVGVIEEAQRQLKLLHDLPYLPTPQSAIFITDETLEGNSQYQTVPGINPAALGEFMIKPRNDWNVFFVGEAFGTGFPHKGLEADFVSAEKLIQDYFYIQPEPFTFDSTGELTSDQLLQTGLAVASSADGSRIAVVSSSPLSEDETTTVIGEVTVYQRIGDEFLGLWKSMGTNFVSDRTTVDLTVDDDGDEEVPEVPEVEVPEVEIPVVNETEVPEVPVANETEVVIDEEEVVDTNTTDLGNTTRRATRRRLSTSSTWDDNTYNAHTTPSSTQRRARRRKLVDRTEMSNMTSVALSGDGRIMAISVVNMESTSGSVQLWKDSTLSGNWTKIGQSLFEEEGEFGYSISLSYDGSVLAVGAPSADDFGAVKVYDCSAVIRGTGVTNPNDMLKSTNEGPSTVTDDVRETFAPATGLLSSVGATSLMNGGGKGSSSSSSMSGSATCSQMGKTMEGIDVVTRYGESVSLSYDGRAVAAGAPNTGLTPAEVGYASVFAYSADSSDWIQVGSLLAGDEALDQFGFSISISAEGRYVAVGAPAMSTGYAKVYEFVEDDWTEVLSTNDSASTEAGSVGGDNIGYSVALSGNGLRLYVGAPQVDVEREGYVLALMQTSPGNWTLAEDSLETLKGLEAGDAMGYSVATDYMGSNIALGAPQSSTGGQGSVRTYVFLEPPPEEDEEMVVTETITVTEPVVEVPFDGSTSEETTTARLIWSDAESSLEDHPPYPWEDNEPCVEGPLLIYPDFLPAAINALGAAMTAALGDSRLTPEVEQALLINMELNEPMIEESCTPLLEAAQMLANDGLIEDRILQVLLERAIASYEAGAGDTTLIPGNETAVETNETSVVVGNETEVVAEVPELELNATELVNRTEDGSGRRDLLVAHGRIGTSHYRSSHRRRATATNAGQNRVSMKNHYKKEDTGSYLSRFRLF